MFFSEIQKKSFQKHFLYNILRDFWNVKKCLKKKRSVIERGWIEGWSCTQIVAVPICLLNCSIVPVACTLDDQVDSLGLQTEDNAIVL